MKENNNQGKSNIAQREEEILDFWHKQGIFDKTLRKESPKGEFVFYDGPPFATGVPHYGSLLPSVIKDAIPRYKTMQGYQVPRRWGWDCHGLPLENKIEEELDLEGKKDIEEYGIEKFNEAARAAVLRYADEWRKIIERTGRWVDMENAYRTMDTSYTESVWWVFKTLFDKGLIYEGHKSMHICPRCGTTLSNFEVSQSYKEIEDISVYVKFKVADEMGTYFLAWTTTPWTLPGNMALAVNKNLTYLKVSMDEYKTLILAEDTAEEALGDTRYEVVERMSGSDLVGMSYEPLFDYYLNADFSSKGRAWKVYHGDFVSVEEGTGVVHIAPAFGEDDLELAKEEGVPVNHHVNWEGRFAPEVEDFAGLLVKPKDDPSQTDEKIVKFLKAQKSIFRIEKITHSYPHCWRCDTPLLNYATSSWFVEVTRIRDKMVSLNREIHWVPEEIGRARFGNWLEGAKDWAISRSRYWGAPLPVWKDPADGSVTIIGSIEELKERVVCSGNKYWAMRHGESESNVQSVVSSHDENKHHLTEEGRQQVRKEAKELKGKGIDLIVASPFARTSETADIVAESIGLSEDDVVEDSRLVEIDAGDYDGASVDEYHSQFSSLMERFEKASPGGGETLADVKKRVGEFLYDLDSMYENRKILIISHDSVLWMLEAADSGMDREQAILMGKELSGSGHHLFELASFESFEFIPLPHNREYELDLHRPYIDEVSLVGDSGRILERVPEVFDCWFESGSMPYGQWHYPHENLDKFNPEESKGFPANFIAEGLDQTRGWFYSMLVLSTALFEKPAYQNVIVNGLILGEDSKKLSKKLGNYPEPQYVIDTYGIDAFRYYILSSPLMRAEDYAISKDGINEVSKKVMNRLGNVLSFYELYAVEEDLESDDEKPQELGVLDKWILSCLVQLNENVESGMENYELDKATRPIGEFIDDLSTWYLRRSRSRFKMGDGNDKQNALWTMRNTLKTFSKIMAPAMPFFAEYLYSKVKTGSGPESVHLCDWPSANKKVNDWLFGAYDEQILVLMREVREIVSEALETRSESDIKVRQPLQKLTLKAENLKGKEEFLQLIKDEVNVKEVEFDSSISGGVELDTTITPELRKEGRVRDVIRRIQELRKRRGFSPVEKAKLLVDTNEGGRKLIENFSNTIKETTLLTEIEFTELTGKESLTFENTSFVFSLEKV